MRSKITDISYYLPETVVSNSDLGKTHPDWDMSLINKRVGVDKRHIARKGETSLDLAIKACQPLFSYNNNLKNKIDGIIFCTQSPDYIMPPNACVLQKHLDIKSDTFAFDINLACSGYIYGLLLARSLIETNSANNILFITAETYSKFIHPDDRSSRVLFGDGAAASLISSSESSSGIIAIKCGASGQHYDKFMIPGGAHRMPRSSKTAKLQKDASGNYRTMENIIMDGMGVLAFVNSTIPNHIEIFLRENNFKKADITLFIFHQASKLALDSLSNLLELPSEKVFRNLSEIGNTVSASIPIALKQAIESKQVHSGDLVLLCGFGVGLSWGSAIIQL